MRVVVIGGGVAGLCAAWELRAAGADVVVVEQSSELGGKIRGGTVGDTPIELGAEMVLTRDPYVPELLARLGLAEELIAPHTTRAAIWSDDQLRPIPTGTMLGVPGDLEALAEFGVTATAEPIRTTPLLKADEDVSVGALVRQQLGNDVVDRLVDPMLGGVYAGNADRLSLRATMPALALACQESTTLVQAVRAVLRPGPAPTTAAPPFVSVRGGLSRLVERLSEGFEVVNGLPVRRIERVAGQWHVTVGDTRAPAVLSADAVVVATPAAPAARLLGDFVEVPSLDYASVALISFAFDEELTLPELSGFLVPASAGLRIKGVTFTSRKWPSPNGRTILRASVGRFGEESSLQLSDADLHPLVKKDLDLVLGLLPEPVAATVTRWGGGLPQYAPGHIARVASVRAALPPALAVAGAAWDGVGIAACMRSGHDAAAALLGAELGV